MNQNQKMHPADLRNLAIFALASFLLWFAFDHFVLQPKIKAAQQTTVAEKTITPNGSAATIPAAPQTRTEILATEGASRIKIETKELSGSINLKGARIDDISLNNYKTELHGKDSVTLLAPSNTKDSTFADVGFLGDGNLPTKDTVWTKTKGDNLTPTTPITLTWDNGQGLKFERDISIDEQYLITVTQRVTNTGTKDETLYPYASVTREGIPDHKQSGVGYEGPIGYFADEIHQQAYSDLLKNTEQGTAGKQGWIGFTDKYWFTSIIPDQTQNQLYRFSARPDNTEKKNSLFQVDVRGDAVPLKAGQTITNTQHIFVGVKKVRLLETYESQLGTKHFDLAIDFGKLYFLTRPMNWLIGLFYSWVGNFGIAIIMLTVLVRAAVFPLASASYRSFAGMRKIAPKMAELKVKYGDDKQKMQQELVALYQTEKVNPMAGCLPLLLQIPIFFAVYKVISTAVEMRHAPFFGWIHDLSAKDPLSVFNLFGLLPYHVPEFLHIGPWSIMMLVLMLIQKHFNPPPTDQIQKDISNFMPWVITFTLSKFPSGLVIYWAFSNLFSVIQQYSIMRSMNVPVYLFSKDEALAYEASHKSNLDAATQKAVEEKTKTASPSKKDEVIEESLFNTNKPEEK